MSPTQPVPEGYHTVTPHLVVKNGAKAIEFYEKAFGAKTLGVSPGPGGTVMHAALKIGDSIVMLNDELPAFHVHGPESIGGTPVTIHLYVDDADKWFKRAIAAGAKEMMPMGDAFWGDRYGQVSDPFGHQWSIATRKENLTLKQIEERAAAAGFGPG